MEKFNNKLLFYFLSGFLALFSFFALSSNAFAFTEITDDISSNTTWNKESSPYIIKNTIAVLPDTTLTINAGVVVKFEYDSSLIVLGKILTNGEENDKVYFTSNNDDTAGGNTNADIFCYEDVDENSNSLGEVCEDYGSDPAKEDWQGLVFYQAEDSLIKNAVFKYADQTLELYSSNVDFENLEITEDHYGVSVYENSRSNISEGTFDNLSGEALQIFNNSSIVANNLNIKNNNASISVFGNSSFTADNLKIEDSSEGGWQTILIFNNSKLSLNHSLLKNCPSDSCISFFDGEEYQDKPSNVSIENSRLESGTGSGLLTFGEGNTVGVIKNSVIKDFAKYGVESYAAYTVDAKNNFWGNATGPYHATLNPPGTAGSVTDNVLFDPWCKTETCKTHNPVILIPGITGSYLLKGDGSNDEIWPNLVKLLLPGADSFLDYLALESDGTENPDRPVVLGDIIRGAVGVHVFDGLIDELISNGYTENTDLFVFPYDWRKSSAESALLLKNRINDILTNQNSERVDIIAHSMGGLVAKKYVVDNADSKVDKVIFLGTPHLGAPKAFKVLMYGDDMNFNMLFNLLKILKPSTAKFISQNMPAVFELLPSVKYVNQNGSYVINKKDENNILNLNYNQTKDLMLAEGRNSLMFPFAESLHDSVDNLDLSNTNTYNFIGCGTKTIGKIILKQKRSWTSLWLKKVDDYDLGLVNGDETVPLVSADGVFVSNKYFVKEITHGSLPSGDGVKEAILSILKGEQASNSPNILSDVATCHVSGKLISTHSPVELHIYDESGNHAGPNSDGDIEENIPKVQYYVLEGEKFAFLPDGINYKVVTKATDIGGYNFEIRNEDENDNTTSTYNWTLIPLRTLRAEGEIWVGPDYPETDYSVKMDEDGNGEVDKTYSVSFDGTSLAEQVTNPLVENPIIGGGGGFLLRQPIGLISPAPTVMVLKNERNEERAVSEKNDKIVSVNSEESIMETREQESSGAVLSAQAESSGVEGHKIWPVALITLVVIGLLAKRFVKV